MKVPVPVKGVVPPFAETVIEVLPPLQAIVPALAVAVNTAGSVIVTFAVVLQLLKSVIVKV